MQPGAIERWLEAIGQLLKRGGLRQSTSFYREVD